MKKLINKIANNTIRTYGFENIRTIIIFRIAEALDIEIKET